MVKLEDKSYEKISGLLKDYFENPDFELNYLINESTIVFFINLSVSKELSPDIIEIIASELDGIFKGSNIVNQEYRYVFDIDTCYVEETAPNREEQLKDVEAILKDFFDDGFIFNYLFYSVNKAKDIPDDVIAKIADCIGGVYENTQIINQEYRVKFKL
ncbi:MAG: hypothetical protein Q4Q32_01330 [Methanobrevibacter sp.]|nr:hypothetical protein [Methanobrevibacter sp.]